MLKIAIQLNMQKEAPQQKLRRNIVGGTFRLACLEGFEPPTYWFVASHSIQLSYKHITHD